MTKNQVKQIVVFLQFSFPNWKLGERQEEAVDVWWMLLKDYPADKIMMAAKVYATSGSHFAPSVGELIAMVKQPSRIAEISESEAWDMVVKACANGGYGYHEEFTKLPQEIQKAIGSERTLQAWATARIDQFQTVIQSNFRRSYREIMDKKHEFENFTSGMQQEALEKRKQILETLPGGFAKDGMEQNLLEDSVGEDLAE